MQREPGQQPTLLDELDARQDDVLDQLDDLNHRIESLLREFTGPVNSGPVNSGPVNSGPVSCPPPSTAVA